MLIKEAEWKVIVFKSEFTTTNYGWYGMTLDELDDEDYPKESKEQRIEPSDGKGWFLLSDCLADLSKMYQYDIKTFYIELPGG